MNKEKQSFSQVSRRDFLKKTALIGAGVTAAATIAGCTTTKVTSETKWDEEVDVLVVGSGTVSVAALAAKDAGAGKVLIIEKAAAFGGTTAISGFGMWVPTNYLQAEKGVTDSKVDALGYLKTISEGQASDEHLNNYLDKAPGMIEWLRDKFNYKFTLMMFDAFMLPDYYNVPGSLPGGRCVFWSINDKFVEGFEGINLIRKTCDELGIEVRLNTTGKKLITNDAGDVIGLVATTENGTDIAIRANKGVILGTGGIDHNDQMKKTYLPGPIYNSTAVPTNTGDGHRMGMAIGADLEMMTSVWGGPQALVDLAKPRYETDWSAYRGKPGTIMVNRHGERFGDESAAYHVFNRSFYSWDSGNYEWRNIPGFVVCDEAYAKKYAFPGAKNEVGVVPAGVQKFNSIEDLASTMGIDAAGLQATLETFNENARNGVDPVWHRGESSYDVSGMSGDPMNPDLKNPALAPIENGPFYSWQEFPGTIGTNGGLRINTNGQVLNLEGDPIKGLYATGNVTGCIFGPAYPGGGGTCGPGALYAMLAARHAVAS